MHARESKFPITRENFRNISLGHPQLDDYIGGAAIGSIVLIEEDSIGTHSDVIRRLYMAQGIKDKHRMFLSSADIDPLLLLEDIPIAQDDDIIDNFIENKKVENLDIAWRYKNLKPRFDHIKHNASQLYSGKYDLSQTLNALDLSNNSFIDTFDAYLQPTPQRTSKKYCDNLKSTYDGLLESIQINLNKKIFSSEIHSQQPNPSNNGITRIILHALGSPYYSAKASSPSPKHEESCVALCRFLLCLKQIIQQTKSIVLITMPVLQYKDSHSHILERIETLCDTVVYMEAFVPINRPCNQLMNNYDGALHIKKVCNMYTLPYKVGPKDLVYKLKRKALLIESLHLPPDFQVNSMNPSIPGMMCSDSSSSSLTDPINSSIDF